MTTSPPGLVRAIAALKVRQGKAREHGLASFPFEATNVRCAAAAGPANENSASDAIANETPTERNAAMTRFMGRSLRECRFVWERRGEGRRNDDTSRWQRMQGGNLS